jgi:hypothetical protein
MTSKMAEFVARHHFDSKPPRGGQARMQSHVQIRCLPIGTKVHKTTKEELILVNSPQLRRSTSPKGEQKFHKVEGPQVRI